VIQRVNAERLVVFGWGRAILMQLAHPLVAAGVDDHSSFRQGRLAAARRLHATIRAMLALTFGTPSEMADAAAGINAIHDRVHGALPYDAGPFPAGTRYSATDPELLRWVDATLRDSLPLAYETFVAPLTARERDEYCADVGDYPDLMRIPRGCLPASRAELDTYLKTMFDSGVLTVTPAAKALAREVLAPPFRYAVWPAARINWLATVGLLPAPLREAYELEWSDRDADALVRWAARLSWMRRRCPERLALWPEAR
jgi:uncharacterized protein (DUF2236 family)